MTKLRNGILERTDRGKEADARPHLFTTSRGVKAEHAPAITGLNKTCADQEPRMTSHGERGKLATCAWFTREQRPLYTTGLAGNMTPSQSMAASSDWVDKDRSFSAPCLLIPSVFASAHR